MSSLLNGTFLLTLPTFCDIIQQTFNYKESILPSVILSKYGE